MSWKHHGGEDLIRLMKSNSLSLLCILGPRSRRHLIQFSRQFSRPTLNSRQIKFFSSPICPTRPMRWCCRCSSTSSQDSRKFVLFPAVTISLSLSSPPKFSRVQLARLWMASKSRRHIRWKSHSLRNKGNFPQIFIKLQKCIALRIF